MSLSDVNYTFKIIVVGDSGVGKSAMITRFTDPERATLDQQATIGVDFKIATLNVCGRKIKLNIWDTAGQERYESITRSYYRSSHGAIITFDLSNRESFNHVAKWHNDIVQLGMPEMPILIVGNKSDLYESINPDPEEILELCEKLNCKYVSTSAKTNSNIEQAFEDMTKLIYEKVGTEQPLLKDTRSNLVSYVPSSSISLRLPSIEDYNPKQPTSKSSCC